MYKHSTHVFKFMLLVIVMFFSSCLKNREHNQQPELGSLQQGLKTSVAVGYCVSIATSAFQGQPLPDNVTFNKDAGLIYIKIDAEHPLPFNKSIGDIILACQWGTDGGVMSVLFGNINITEGDMKLYGLYLIPFIKRAGENEIRALFIKQDIIVGNGSDTILDLSNITAPVFNAEMDRLNEDKPSDAFAVVKQNVWFVNVDQNATFSDPYDDNITVSGGGQIVEAAGETGGIIYHALIDAKINYSICSRNPISGNALSQNFKAGGVPLIDLGNSYLQFHENCDGMVHVIISTGKYLGYSNKDIPLDL